MATKIKGRLIATFSGLKIYASISKPKRRGKERMWISIRQDKPKEWRVSATLSYVNAIDVRFEK